MRKSKSKILSAATIEAVRSIDSRVVVRDYLGMFVVKIAGRMAPLCPFHEDKKPGSAFVFPQGLRCFACGPDPVTGKKYRDNIEIVRQVKGYDFVEAVEFLAQCAGIPVEYEGTAQSSRAASFAVRKDDLAEIDWTAAKARKVWDANPAQCVARMDSAAERMIARYRGIDPRELYPEAAEIVNERTERLLKFQETLKPGKTDKSIKDKKIKII